MNIRTLALLGSLSLSLAFGALGCQDKPTRWDTAATSTVARAPDAPKVVDAGSFNKFFPGDGIDGMKRVYTQEKTGFAEAKLQEHAGIQSVSRRLISRAYGEI